MRVCWCVMLWLAAPALPCGPGVCVCMCVCVVWRLVLVWAVWGVRVLCTSLVWVCVRAVCGLWGMSYLVRFTSLAGMVTIKGRKRGAVNV